MIVNSMKMVVECIAVFRVLFNVLIDCFRVQQHRKTYTQQPPIVPVDIEMKGPPGSPTVDLTL
jgi:hypothetical protein